MFCSILLCDIILGSAQFIIDRIANIFYIISILDLL